LRVLLAGNQRLPLRPVFLQFEDPEYNRRLTSQAARATRVVTYESGAAQAAVELTLAADRREYNPTSDLLLALFRERDVKEKELGGYKVTLKKLDASGIEHTLTEG